MPIAEEFGYGDDGEGSEAFDDSTVMDYFLGHEYFEKNDKRLGSTSPHLTKESSKVDRTSYFQRCKAIGRIGPPRTELDRSSAYGEYLFGHERILGHTL